MTLNHAVPLPDRGKTMYGTDQTIDTANYNDAHLEGTLVEFKNFDPTDRTKVNSSSSVVCQLVRNVSGIALLPSRTVQFSAGFNGRRVDGYARTTAARIDGIVDDMLPSAGVRNGDLFWIIRKGEVRGLTDLATGAGNVHAEHDRLVALTAATSQATTAGRLTLATQTVTEAALADVIMHHVRALSANTTAQSNRQIRVAVNFLR